MLVARVLELASKLAAHRMLHDDTATTSLGRVLGVGQCGVDDQYRALVAALQARRLLVLRVFVKKTQATPRKAIDTARQRLGNLA